jgi:hypothetical protein
MSGGEFRTWRPAAKAAFGLVVFGVTYVAASQRVPDQMLLGDPLRRLAFGLTLLLLAAVGPIWLRWRARRPGDSSLAHQAAQGLAVSLSSVGLGVVFSAFWGLPGVIVFLVVAMAVCGVGVVVMFVRGAQGSSRTR